MRSPLFVSAMSLSVLAAPLLFGQNGGDSYRDIPDAIVKKVDPSVVAIQHERAGGSGFLISRDGYILTNGHVVRGMDPQDPRKPARMITVVLHDERKFPAKVLGFCMDPDVALIKIDAPFPTTPVELGDSRHAEIGQNCFAVGTPVGLKRTFTRGIISNVNRADLDTFTPVLQTDAAINSGNSGGPLFDSEGRVLGINTYAAQGRNNLGFTIPIHVAMLLKDHFMEHGRFVRADLPLFYTGQIYDELATALGVDHGVIIHYVMEDTPAWEAGLRAGDVITAIDGKPCVTHTEADFLWHEWEMATRKPGDTVEFTLSRGTPGQRTTIKQTVTLEEMEPLPAMGRFGGELREHRYDPLGLGFKRLVRLHRVLYGLGDDPGVLVTRVVNDSPADNAGLEGSDIITAVGGTPVTDIASFQEALESELRAKTRIIDLLVSRDRAEWRTALVPYYDLKNSRVLVVTPSTPTEHLAQITRDLLAHGAETVVVSASPASPGDAGQSLEEAMASKYDILLLVDGENPRELWNHEPLAAAIRDAYAQEKILAAMGSASLALVMAEPALLEKKITTSQEESSEALRIRANYTGKDVETDGKVLTTTAVDHETVTDFLKALRLIARNGG